MYVCDFSPHGKGSSHLTKLLGGLNYKKIRRYNNSSPYVMARLQPQQIPPLKFHGLVTCGPLFSLFNIGGEIMAKNETEK